MDRLDGQDFLFRHIILSILPIHVNISPEKIFSSRQETLPTICQSINLSLSYHFPLDTDDTDCRLVHKAGTHWLRCKTADLFEGHSANHT